MSTAETLVKWWGKFPFTVGESRTWHVGSQTIAVMRHRQEWRVAHKVSHDGEREAAAVAGDEPPFVAEDWSRFVTQHRGQTLSVGPRLADRPVVSRPANPFHLLPGQHVVIFVSSPLWLVMRVDEGPELAELPLVPLSDTWFGPSPREGELCYAARTHARLELEAIPRRTHRVITPVRVHNRAETSLHLERLSLPLPYLSVYRVARGDLWTEAITLSRAAANDIATLEIEPGPPTWVRKGELLAPPRSRADRGLLVRAFGILFS